MEATIVTPVQSQEDPFLQGESNEWFDRIQSGDKLSASDWEELLSKEHQTSTPYLTLESLRANEGGTVVRMCAMVQDMMDVEYFYPNDSVAKEPQLLERTPLVLAPLPFTTLWFRKVLDEGNSPFTEAAMAHRDKRPRLDQEEPEAEGGTSSAPSLTLRKFWNAKEMQSDPHHAPAVGNFYYDSYPSSATDAPRLRLNDIVEVLAVVDSADHEDVEDQQLPSIFGTPSLSSPWNEIPSAIPECVPRVHVLWYRSVCLETILHSSAEYSMSSSPTSMSSTALSSWNADMSTSTLTQALGVSETVSSALLLTLLSIAERQSDASSRNKDTDRSQTPDQQELEHWSPLQTPQETVVGCASLNIVLKNSDDAWKFHKHLAGVLDQLVPVCVTLDLATATTTGCGEHGYDASIRLLPTQSRGIRRLLPTPLQLVRGSTLIIMNASDQFLRDCTNITTGSSYLAEALKQLTFSHSIPYTFEGGIQLSFEADCRIIVISTRNTRELLPCTLEVECRNVRGDDGNAMGDDSWTPPESSDSSEFDMSHRTWASFREFLILARRGSVQEELQPNTSTSPGATNIGLTAALLEKAQVDFCERRGVAREAKDSKIRIPGELDLHRWLTLTRLFARTRRSGQAELCDWERALQLEDAIAASK